MLTITGTSSTTPSGVAIDLNYLVARVSKLLARSDLDTEIVEWINFAQRELCDKVNFPELRNTQTYNPLTVGVFTLTLPSNFSRADRIYYVDTTASPTWGRSVQISPRRLYKDIERLLNISSPVSGDPHIAFIDRPNNLYVYPAPSKAARIDLIYYKTPVDMVNGAEVPSINNEWRQYLVPLAFYWGEILLEKSDINQVLFWEKKFDSVIKKVKSLVYMTENKEDFVVVPSLTPGASQLY